MLQKHEIWSDDVLFASVMVPTLSFMAGRLLHVVRPCRTKADAMSMADRFQALQEAGRVPLSFIGYRPWIIETLAVRGRKVIMDIAYREHMHSPFNPFTGGSL